MSPLKTADPIEMQFGVETRVGPGNQTLDGCSDPPMRRGNFEGGRAAHCKTSGPSLSAVMCKKGAEVIKMPFVTWTRVDPRNHVYGGTDLAFDKGQF